MPWRRRIDHRRRHGDQFPGARDIGLAGGAGEQSVVTDAMAPFGRTPSAEPLRQNVQQEAPDVSCGVSVIVRNRARPLRR
jgi:hypothetical protein